MTALLSVKLIVSTRDGSHGYLEQNNHPQLAPRVFRLASDGEFLEQCSLESFNVEGNRARRYGTNFKLCDMEAG